MNHWIQAKRPSARADGRLWFVCAVVVLAAMGGLWSATLARVLAELWPRWLIDWRSPAMLALGGTLGALLFLAGLRVRGCVRGEPGAILGRWWPLAISGLYLAQPGVEPLWGAAALIAGLGGVWRARRPAEWQWNIVVFIVPLVLYIATLSPSVLPGDSGEFQFVTPILGIPHPTGYPLYLLVGKLFTWLPWGSVAYRLNLFSAVAAAGAVWAVYRASRALDLGRAASTIGAAMLMVSETFWSQAVIADKYAFNAFWVAATLWLGLEWRKTRSTGWLYLWAVCGGLSLTHHRTMVLLAPAWALLLWFTDRSILHPGSRVGRRLALLTLLPLSLYLVLPLFSAFDPPYAYVRVDSVRAFFDLVLARTYQSGFFRGGFAALPGRLVEFGRLLWRQFTPLGLLLAAGGWASLWFRKRRVAWVLLAGAAAEAFWALNYYVPNTLVYYLPVYVWMAVCIGGAVEQGAAWVRRSFCGRGRRSAALLGLLAISFLPACLLVARLPGMDQRRVYAGEAFDHTYGQIALRAVEPNALIVGDWRPATVLWYVQLVDGLAPTAQIVAVDSLEGQWSGYVEQGLREGRAVYLARPLMDAAGQYALGSAGPLVRVFDAPQNAPDGSRLQPPGPKTGVGLCGFDLWTTPPGAEGMAEPFAGGVVRGGSTLHLTLRWEAGQTIAGDHAVAVRLLGAEGKVVLEKQNRHPVGGAYPTSRWQAGQMVADYYELALPPCLPSGVYRLQATVGAPFGGERDLFDLGALELQKPLRWPYAGLETPMRQAVGADLVLVGCAPRELVVGEQATVSLLWLVRRRPADWPMLASAGLDQDERPLAVAERQPDQDWRPGALVRQSYHFAVDAALPGVNVCLADDCYALPLRVVEAPPPVANFGDIIRLRGYGYEQDALDPGGMLRLTLEWEAVGAISEPYRVFVHVLGHNGLPVAQQDNEPVDGTYPTTRWRRGERVVDRYAFALPAGLPPGEYQVEVGLYRLADFGRLPVLGQDRRVLDDKVLLSPIVVN